MSVSTALAVKPIKFEFGARLRCNRINHSIPAALPARFAPAELLPGTTLSTDRISL